MTQIELNPACALPAEAEKAASRFHVRALYPFDYPVLAFCVVAAACSWAYGFSINWSVAFDMLPEFVLLGQGAPWIVAGAYLWQRDVLGRKPSDILRQFRTNVQSGIRDWRMWYEVLRMIIALRICLMVFIFLKQALPIMNPRLYDAELAAADRWLHVGVSPVEMALAAFSWPLSARALDLLYVLWYAVKGPVLLLFLFHPDARRRWHFMTAYVLLWIVGWVGYICLPSVGPEYANPAQFAGINTPAADSLQAWLWQTYSELRADPTHYRMVIYSGVAAFPSLHVGMAVLFAIALRPYRVAFWLMALFALCMQVGSVFLGWHYAIDGYAGGILAALCYYGIAPLFSDRKAVVVAAAPAGDRSVTPAS